MKTLHPIILSSSAILLSMFTSLMILGDNTAQGLIPPALDQRLISPEFEQDLHNHGYEIVRSNTTEWFLWSNHYFDILNYSDIIFTGDITSTNILNVTSFYTIGNMKSPPFMEMTYGTTSPPYKKINYTLNLEQYTVNVDEFLKNPQRSNNMIIREPIVDPTWHSDPLGPRFNVGDHVLFYEKNLDGSNVYSQTSFKIPKTCNATDVLAQNRYAGAVFTMTQNGVQVDYSQSVENKNHFTANQPIEFMYSMPIDTLSGKDSVVKIEISRDPSNEIVLSKEINASSKICNWQESAKLESSLGNGDYYSAIFVKNDDGTFRPMYSVSFSVNQNATNISLPSSKAFAQTASDNSTTTSQNCAVLVKARQLENEMSGNLTAVSQNCTTTILEEHFLTEQILYATIEMNYSGFGGMFIDKTGTLNVYVTDPVKAESIGTKIITRIMEPYHPVSSIVFLKGKQNWDTWAKWQGIANQLFANKSLNVTLVSIDQKNQTLMIGLKSLDKEKTAIVDTFLESHQIPLDMVQSSQMDIEPVPEFPYAVLILLVGIASLIAFYRIRIRK